MVDASGSPAPLHQKMDGQSPGPEPAAAAPLSVRQIKAALSERGVDFSWQAPPPPSPAR